MPPACIRVGLLEVSFGDAPAALLWLLSLLLSALWSKLSEQPAVYDEATIRGLKT